MRKSKIDSLFELPLIFFLIIVILVTIFRLNHPPKSIYKNEKSFTGIITNIKQNTCQNITLKAKEKLLVYECSNKKYNIGQKVKVDGILNKPKNSINFNYEKYLLSQNIYYLVYAKKITVIDNNSNTFYKIKNYLYERTNDFKTKEYLRAFVLGDPSLIDKEVQESFKVNGISHLLAISGMQVTLLSTILFLIFNKFLNKKISYVIISLFFLFYIFVTNFSPSIIRAVFMFIIINIGDKKNNLLYLVFLFCICLLINPFYLYHVGFLFSYIITLFLILFSDLIVERKNYLTKTLITSIIAFLASIPILIDNFNSINFLSPLINVIFVPFVSLIIYPCSLITFIFPIFDIPLGKMIDLFEKVSILISKFSILSFNFKDINLYTFIIYYLIIFVVLTNTKNIVFLIGILIFHYNINIFIPQNNITVIDVGQGDSIFLENGKSNVLIDTGGNVNKKNTSQNTVIPYLKKSGSHKLDYLILTHGDFDHMGDAINLVDNFKVEKVIFNCGEFNDLEKKLISVLNKKNIKYYSCIKELNFNNNKLHFLNNKDYGNENDNSIVLYTEINNKKFLFMGDASVKTEKDILTKYNLNDIDVIKIGHHGSKTSSSKEFIDKINPKYSVISVGKNNRYGHPNNEVLDVLNNSKMFRTDINGSIMFKFKNNKLDVDTCPP